MQVGGEPVHLTPTEFDLLALLAARPGVVYTREQLLADVWGWRDGSGQRTVDSHVRGLRAQARRAGSCARSTASATRWRREACVRPLDRLRSIKVKLGVVIVATVVGTVAVLALGRRAGLDARVARGAGRRRSGWRWCSSSRAA